MKAMVQEVQMEITTIEIIGDHEGVEEGSTLDPVVEEDFHQVEVVAIHQTQDFSGNHVKNQKLKITRTQNQPARTTVKTSQSTITR